MITTQKEWLEYLQTFSKDPIITCKIIGEQYSKWEVYTNFTLPITLRRPLSNELVLDFDSQQKKRNYDKAKEILDFLNKTTWPHYLTDHSGRGPHIHVFNISYAKAKALFKMFNTNIGEILCGKKLSREIGGLYKDGLHYCSYFPNIENIKPIIRLEDVRFPQLNLSVEQTVFNPIWDEVKKHKAEKEYDYVSDTIVCLDNLPPKYKHLEHGVGEGERNNAMCQLIGVFKKCGLSMWDCRREMMRFNNKCSPPLPEKDVEYKIKKLWK